MDAKEFTELMQNSAKDAVLFAKEEYQIELDFSLNSIADIDKIIAQLSIQALDDKALFTYSFLLGSYLGEVYIQSYNGHWLYEEETEDEPPQTFVVDGDKTFAFPSKIYHSLVGTEEHSINEYFEKIAEQTSVQ
ncbi:hypothetical protein F9L16_06605 [Agarivorans sp. B2Z047]|uniref:DUF3806 domain-containing protein n=1 Tax=Agarivorans albus MKT 106 TaxID=1331007 RepID=R9PN37_AGAAL|nr:MULTISPECIES: hypothetical protein [Agarivorans]MPW28673.1 hypothetical protein [Agarivorans sp. B2Z047]UQN41234.1 hypothetical protein LQZ07_15810 [Agarivorans sp. B2Z047]GAD02693.1 hypothetical protein AALB_2773 [Agarivorans albus MKT 106]